MEASIIHGFGNEAGANNCFLNSVLQILWGLRPFREKLLASEAHACTSRHNCVTCSVKVLFTHLKHADEKNIQPHILREALAMVDFDRFGLTRMADATECFTTILEELHKGLTNSTDDEGCVHPPCLVHEFFGLNLTTQETCACGFLSEPSVTYAFVEYFQASTLRAGKLDNSARTFGEILRITSQDNMKHCEARGCSRTISNSRWLMTDPKVVSIGLSWASPHSTEEEIADILDTVDENLVLKHWFTTDSSSQVNLCGVVCYYGMHYVVYTWKRGTWLLFSDEHMSHIGPSYADNVIPHCISNRYQPVLLIYENKRALYPDEAAPIVSAPTTTTRTTLTSAPPAAPLPPVAPRHVPDTGRSLDYLSTSPKPLSAPVTQVIRHTYPDPPRRERIVLPPDVPLTTLPPAHAAYQPSGYGSSLHTSTLSSVSPAHTYRPVGGPGTIQSPYGQQQQQQQPQYHHQQQHFHYNQQPPQQPPQLSQHSYQHYPQQHQSLQHQRDLYVDQTAFRQAADPMSGMIPITPPATAARAPTYDPHLYSAHQHGGLAGSVLDRPAPDFSRDLSENTLGGVESQFRGLGFATGGRSHGVPSQPAPASDFSLYRTREPQYCLNCHIMPNTGLSRYCERCWNGRR